MGIAFWIFLFLVIVAFLARGALGLSITALSSASVGAGLIGFGFLAGLGIASLISSFKKAKKEHEEEDAAGSRRRLGFRQQTFPPPFPNGWYKLCHSSDLPRGTVKYIEACGQHLAVFRPTSGGDAAVLEAYCPHLGANMAIGSNVVGDCLQCPFHLWEFDKNGKVAHIPYYDGELPANTKAKTYYSEERFGFVLFWFDAENRLPQWHLSPIPSIETENQMTFRGRLPPRIVHMHIQDFEENGVDFAHFPVLHSKMRWPWTQITLPFIRIHHVAAFDLDEKQPHIAYFRNTARLVIFGKEFPKTEASAVAHFNGSGGVIYFVFDIPNMGQIIVFECHTPVEPMGLKVDFNWWADRKIPNFLVSYVVGQWYSQWQNDLQIWENKIYRRPPIVLKTDGPVAKFRRWYSQFYSENSEKVAAAAVAARACSW